jgi:hypothetical protein
VWRVLVCPFGSMQGGRVFREVEATERRHWLAEQQETIQAQSCCTRTQPSGSDACVGTDIDRVEVAWALRLLGPILAI